MTIASPSDHDLAGRLATEAGRILLDLRKSGLEGDELEKAGDRRSHEFLTAALNETRPDDGVLSEEGADSSTRLGHRRVWVVDPLDGTREFGERPRDDWAVHVGLAIEGIAVIGAVALPARGLTLGTATPPVVPPRRDGPIRLAVSRTRPPEHTHALADRLGADVVPMGSAGVKAMAVVLGEADLYAHSGGQYEWDSAAPVAVAVAAGLHASRLDGTPLRYNQPNPWLPDLLICRPELADQVVAICREAASS